MEADLKILRVIEIGFVIWQDRIDVIVLHFVAVTIPNETGLGGKLFIRCRTIQTNEVVTKKCQGIILRRE